MPYSQSIPRPIMIAAGMALLAGLGAYFLYGSEKGPQRRRQLRGLLSRMKEDVMEEVDKLKSINEEAYKQVMSEIKDKYAKFKNMDASDVASLVLRIQRHWRDMQKDIDQTAAKAISDSDSGASSSSSTTKGKRTARRRRNKKTS